MSSLLDTALDRTIAPGYGNVGLAIRKRLPGWPDDPPRMDGKVVMITGAASGIGLAAGQGFARLGATVLAVGRNQERADEAARAIGGDARGIACDISSVAALNRLEVDQLDVLVNNAGVMPPERVRSADGVELCFATHVLAPWILTQRFAPQLERVINVISGGMYAQGLNGGDLTSEDDDYSPKLFYARTKRAEMVITEQWAERLERPVVHAMHPGWVDTKGVQDAMPLFRKLTRPILRDLDAGADTVVWLGAAPEPLQSTGGLWMDRRRRPTHYRVGASPDGAADRAELWELCERLASSSVAR